MCNQWVQFVLKYDASRKVRFVSLHSSLAHDLLQEHRISYEKNDLKTIFYLKNERVYDRSEAILEILLDVGFPWCMLGVLKILPRRLRDGFYGFVSMNRHKFFVQRESCFLVSKEDRERIIDTEQNVM